MLYLMKDIVWVQKILLFFLKFKIIIYLLSENMGYYSLNRKNIIFNEKNVLLKIYANLKKISEEFLNILKDYMSKDPQQDKDEKLKEETKQIQKDIEKIQNEFGKPYIRVAEHFVTRNSHIVIPFYNHENDILDRVD